MHSITNDDKGETFYLGKSCGPATRIWRKVVLLLPSSRLAQR